MGSNSPIVAEETDSLRVEVAEKPIPPREEMAVKYLWTRVMAYFLASSTFTLIFMVLFTDVVPAERLEIAGKLLDTWGFIAMSTILGWMGITNGTQAYVDARKK